MKKNTSKKTDEEFKEKQSTSSPGALGEDVNMSKRDNINPIKKDNAKTSKEEGLNQERSAGDAGAFEGLENTSES